MLNATLMVITKKVSKEYIKKEMGMESKWFHRKDQPNKK